MGWHLLSVPCWSLSLNPPPEVLLLMHIHHAGHAHRADDGDVAFDEEYDDFKIIGIYDSEPQVSAAWTRAVGRPGFEAEPECFIVDRYVLNQDEWAEGFSTMSDLI